MNRKDIPSESFANGYPIPDEKDFEFCLEEWEAEAEELGIEIDGLFTPWALGALSEQKPPPKPLPPLRRLGPGWMTTLKDIEGKQ